MWNLLSTLIGLAFILAAGVLLGSWMATLLRGKLQRQRLALPTRRVLVDAVPPVFVLFSALIALDWLGLSTLPLAVLLGAMLVAASLGFRDTLANLNAGLILSGHPGFEEGNQVVLGDTIGTVTHIGLLTCTLSAAEGVETVLANRLILDGPIEIVATKEVP